MISISDNGRHFTNNGKPYFLLADTAWTLFQKLDIHEIEVYLRNRKEKGFNTVYAVLINFQSRDDKSTFDLKGNVDVDELLTDEYKGFWSKVVDTIRLADKLGLHMGLLPVWGNVVKNGNLREDNLLIYLDFLIGTFGSFDNIFWILGGDIRGDNSFELWDKMGSYLKNKMPEHIIGYHPFGRTSSSYWFHDREWLDFNMFQSGHRRGDQRNLNAWDDRESNEPWYGEENFRYVMADSIKEPNKPVLDGEPSYEQIPQGLHDQNEPYWQDYHVRRYAYWSAFSGAAGHVYGHNSVMQFYGTGSRPAYGAKETWDKGIHDVGSSQMKFLKELMESLDYTNGKPLQHMLDSVVGSLDENVFVFGTENHFACYNYSGRNFRLIRTDGTYEYYWFDPVSGVKSFGGSIKLDGSTIISPSKKNAWNDWVLILSKVSGIK